jgi:hypothetical protein
MAYDEQILDDPFVSDSENDDEEEDDDDAVEGGDNELAGDTDEIAEIPDAEL